MEVKPDRWQHPEIASLKQNVLCSYCSRAILRMGREDNSAMIYRDKRGESKKLQISTP